MRRPDRGDLTTFSDRSGQSGAIGGRQWIGPNQKVSLFAFVKHEHPVCAFKHTAKLVGVDPKTVQAYYKILEDTSIGRNLLPFSYSFRKKLIKSPKFYFFDLGVVRSISRHFSLPLIPSTSYFGDCFESFVLNQTLSLISYHDKDYRMSFYHDENQVEVDLVIERPGEALLFVEIKSSEEVIYEHTKSLRMVGRDFATAKFRVWSRDLRPKKIENIVCLPWQEGIKELLGL